MIDKETTMSPKTSRVTPDRSGKRAQFETRTETKRKSPLMWIGAVALFALLAGGIIFALGRTPTPSSAAPAATQKSSPGQPAASAVKAATLGHEPYPLVQADGNVVTFALATFDDYQIRYYTYVSNGKPIEFFILKSKDGVVRAAFNACDVCYPAKKGYRQEGDEVVCNNCGRRFPSNQINEVQGGCNPSPLKRSVEGDSLIIRVEEIAAGLSYF